MIYDSNGNTIDISTADDFSRLFNVEEVIYLAGTERPYTEGTYFPYPMHVSQPQPQLTFRFKDADGNWCTGTTESGNTVGRSDNGAFSIRSDAFLKLTATGGEYGVYMTADQLNSKIPHASTKFTWDNQPVTMIFVNDFSKDIDFLEDETVDNDQLLRAEINKERSIGLVEQIEAEVSAYSLTTLNDDLLGSDDKGRKFKSSLIRLNNSVNHAIRIATFNVKGSGGNGKNNWYMLKRCVENFGIDICGMQEVSFPLNEPKFKDYFEGWLFPYVSDNGDAYRQGDGAGYEGKNERMLLSRYPIDSTEEIFYQSAQNLNDGDYRYYAKSVISLPRYMSRKGSENLKISVYNTQLEVRGWDIAQAQANELAQIASADPNPFVVIMGDTNDDTLNKVVWQAFENYGFNPILPVNGTTIAVTGLQCLDNFFVNSRIKAINWDVVGARRFPWVSSSSHVDLSDHDLAIADVQLDYSDVHCVETVLTNCTIDFTKGWISESETVSITITADSGYTLGAITCRDCVANNTEAISINGNVITIDGSKLLGDIIIRCTATAIESAS